MTDVPKHLPFSSSAVQPVHLIRLGQLWDNRPGGRGKEENGFTQ